MAPSPASRRGSNLILAIVFLATIGAPLLATAVGVEGGDQAAENRQLAPFPQFDGSWRSIRSYPANFDSWFADHFAFRKHMVRWFGESRYVWLGVSPTPSVVVGKHSFLFFAVDESIDDYANSRPFTERELLTWRESITRIRNWCRARGIAYAFTIAPDKYLVYPEEFPDGVRQVNPMSRADQLYAAVSDTAVAVDTRPVLNHAKSVERIYYLTDTHWNDRGAFAAYQSIINAVRAQDPRVPAPWERSDFDAVSREIEGQDLAGMMGLTHVLHEDELALVPRRPRLAQVVQPKDFNPRESIGRLVTEIPGSTLPRAVIFRDSFTDGLVPFLSEHFSRAVYLWQNDVDPDDILKEHADVVIQEIVSRHLYSFGPSPALIPAAR
jgi:alginate O-acetyltransferase complex protein AlgJ